MGKWLIPMLLVLACGGTQNKAPDTTTQQKGQFMIIQVKDFGTVKVKLYRDEVPKNTQNMIDLAKKGFFDGLVFHRIIPGFVIQGGCPRGDGTGDPGYKVDDEIVPKLKHSKGTVAMANSGPNTNGSQFYICLADQPRLDGRYTIIGTVVDGLDVVMKLGSVETSGPPNDRPLKCPIMEKVWIEE